MCSVNSVDYCLDLGGHLRVVNQCRESLLETKCRLLNFLRNNTVETLRLVVARFSGWVKTLRSFSETGEFFPMETQSLHLAKPDAGCL